MVHLDIIFGRVNALKISVKREYNRSEFLFDCMFRNKYWRCKDFSFYPHTIYFIKYNENICSLNVLEIN